MEGRDSVAIETLHELCNFSLSADTRNRGRSASHTTSVRDLISATFSGLMQVGQMSRLMVFLDAVAMMFVPRHD